MNYKDTKLYSIFGISALFFAFFSFVGVYERAINDYFWFVVYFIYEIILYLGLKSGGLVFGKRQQKKCYEIYLSKQGTIICFGLNCISLLSFLYFLFLYIKTVGLGKIGTYNPIAFQEGRTVLEKLSLLLMQIGGEVVYLIIHADNQNNYKYRKLATVCLFLPGIRALFLGGRYTIAVEFIIFLYINWYSIRKIVKKKRKRIYNFFIFVATLIVLYVFIKIFEVRSSPYLAYERFEFYPGDMQLKRIWLFWYGLTNGKISPFYMLSDYVSEAPYVFAFYCKNRMPEGILYGRLTFRSILQIISTINPDIDGYIKISSLIASGKYSGFAFVLIADFGRHLAPIMAYLFGLIMSKVEKYKDNNRIFKTLYPALVPICFFAPIYYFYVGRIDYVVLFVVVVAPFCLKMDKSIRL